MPKSYDYIVVGAGAAGCVLANRLSADPGVSVLLLEAGGRDLSPLVHIPAGFGMLMGTKVNWLFDTVPQKFMRGRRMFLPQGKVLGGSTAVNAMLYVRGNRGDYDTWRDLGNKGWGYDDVLPYFKVHEHNERLGDDYHGVDGELNVADQVQHNPMSQAFVTKIVRARIRLDRAGSADAHRNCTRKLVSSPRYATANTDSVSRGIAAPGSR